MDKKSQEFKNLIYDLANGSLDLEHFPVAESKYVENEYEEGKLCNRLYSEMRDAYDRICARLGKPDQEDRDVPDGCRKYHENGEYTYDTNAGKDM